MGIEFLHPYPTFKQYSDAIRNKLNATLSKSSSAEKIIATYIREIISLLNEHLYEPIKNDKEVTFLKNLFCFENLKLDELDISKILVHLTDLQISDERLSIIQEHLAIEFQNCEIQNLILNSPNVSCFRGFGFVFRNCPTNFLKISSVY